MTRVDAFLVLQDLKNSDTEYGKAIYKLYLQVIRLIQRGGGDIKIHGAPKSDNPLSEWFWGTCMEQCHGIMQMQSFVDPFGYQADIKIVGGNGNHPLYGLVSIRKTTNPKLLQAQ